MGQIQPMSCKLLSSGLDESIVSAHSSVPCGRQRKTIPDKDNLSCHSDTLISIRGNKYSHSYESSVQDLEHEG